MSVSLTKGQKTALLLLLVAWLLTRNLMTAGLLAGVAFVGDMVL